MKWHRSALNPQALDRLYDDVPELDGVELFSVELNFERSNIRIRFDLPEFPDRPPKRRPPGFNTVQVELAFWRITDFAAQGWPSDGKVKIEIENDERSKKVFLSNPETGLTFSFSCETFRIENVTAYQNE
jgi:hypothetical protein